LVQWLPFVIINIVQMSVLDFQTPTFIVIMIEEMMNTGGIFAAIVYYLMVNSMNETTMNHQRNKRNASLFSKRDRVLMERQRETDSQVYF
jgi:hypothetical protein